MSRIHLFFPAPGNRGRGTGALCSVGYSGYSWSSVVATGSDAYFLGFYDSGLNPQNSSGRAYGLQVRCLLE